MLRAEEVTELLGMHASHSSRALPQVILFYTTLKLPEDICRDQYCITFAKQLS